MITDELYREVRARLAAAGFAGEWEWAQSVRAPDSAEVMASEYTWVVLNSGMKNTIAREIMDRVWPTLTAGKSIYPATFGHAGKAHAIESVWRARALLFESLPAALATTELVLQWCEALPWIGAITKYHLAKNLGADVAKPDRWLVRLADAEGATVDGLCARLAAAVGDRIATVDVVLWRACAIGLLVVDAGNARLSDR